ncbi:hypothetical protein RMSM_03418 [Rhodopirellula maiorica SM1]|uniref:Uncharacterized protein n=1 Tax=Rhodopirellula maiorica SM1 TaxID=1265738 RepID=M5S0J0_9BACT|nr:hypothetical protein RMSM_03418 [Rhodopirellula maiorica SM1]
MRWEKSAHQISPESSAMTSQYDEQDSILEALFRSHFGIDRDQYHQKSPWFRGGIVFVHDLQIETHLSC